MAVIELGGGRIRPDDRIDHRVGLTGLRPLGTKVEKGEPIAFVHAADRSRAEAIAKRVATLYAIADEEPGRRPVIVSKLRAG